MCEFNYNNLESDIELKLKSNIGKCICRLCFNNTDALIPISYAWEEAIPPALKFNLSKTPVRDILRFYIGDEINSYSWDLDGVCRDCLWKIYTSFDFISYCRVVEKVLKNSDFHSGIKLESIEEDTFFDSTNGNYESGLSEDVANLVENKSAKELKFVQDKKLPLALEVDSQIEEALLSGPHECSVCKKHCKDAKSLITHRKLHGVNVHQCVKCGKGYTTARGARIHMRQHYDARPEVCLTCGAAFRDPRSLRTHCATKHVGIKPFECNECGKKFAKKIALQLHLKTHTGDRPHVCDVCGKSYIQAHSLVVHKRQHSGERPFLCKLCPKTFSNSSSLKMHLPVHTERKDYVCTVCGKMVARVSELNVHMRIHTGQKPYKCKICSKTFTNSSALSRHKVTHSGEKRHICDVCNRRYSQLNELTKHMYSHSGNKLPLNCRLCPALLSTKAALRRHHRIHTGEKRHKCPQCHRAFTEPHVLKNHMHTHSGAKPFSCEICLRSFSQSVTLKAHSKIHTDMPKMIETITNCKEENNKHVPMAFL